MKTIIGLIPARKNSKGIKNKNIALLNGRYLIEYTMESASKSKLADCYCSSDSNRTIEIAKGCNCKTIKRPSELASDEASMLSVVKHFRDYLNNEEIEFDAIMVLYPTHPLRDYRLINEAIETFDGVKSIIGFAKHSKHPFLYYKVEKNRSFNRLCDFDIDEMYRRQSYPEYYYIISHSICILPKSEIDSCNSQLYNKNSIAFIIKNPMQSIDIDSVIDLKFTELLMKV